ncbi:hypothetical protein H7142_01630 [Candidatus Saccharibacteria bacterium]|nr:hypothetical protein [Candidatus Saccharibacteria bacterium]
MKKGFSVSSVLVKVGYFFRRFHTLLFFLTVSGGLFIAILMLLSIISLSSTTASGSTQNIDGAFDEETIQRVKTDSTDQITPGARRSPFVE